MKYKLLAFVLLLPIFACGWNQTCVKPRSYNIGMEKKSSIGSEMLQTGCYAAKWEPTGLNKHLFNRESYDDTYFTPYTEKELLYSGRENNILHITYREYYLKFSEYGAASLAREPFFQHVYYDLKTSDEIVFQDWVIKVLDANNKEIRFKVVKEPPIK
jgi:hypothetical protein